MHRHLVLFVHQSSEMYGSDNVLLFFAQVLQKNCQFHPGVVLPEAGPLHTVLLASGVKVHIGEVEKKSRAVLTSLVHTTVCGMQYQGKFAGLDH